MGEHLPQIFGMKIKKYLKPPPVVTQYTNQSCPIDGLDGLQRWTVVIPSFEPFQTPAIALNLVIFGPFLFEGFFDFFPSLSTCEKMPFYEELPVLHQLKPNRNAWNIW